MLTSGNLFLNVFTFPVLLEDGQKRQQRKESFDGNLWVLSALKRGSSLLIFDSQFNFFVSRVTMQELFFQAVPGQTTGT